MSKYLIPNPHNSANGRQGVFAHLNLHHHKDGWSFVEDTGMYASHCKPFAWAATGWLSSNNLGEYKLCKKCERLIERVKK